MRVSRFCLRQFKGLRDPLAMRHPNKFLFGYGMPVNNTDVNRSIIAKNVKPFSENLVEKEYLHVRNNRDDGCQLDIWYVQCKSCLSNLGRRGL